MDAKLRFKQNYIELLFKYVLHVFYICFSVSLFIVNSLFIVKKKKKMTPRSNYTRICKTKPKVEFVCRFSEIVGNFQHTSYDTNVQGLKKTFIVQYSLTFFAMGKLKLNFSINLYLF